MLNIVNEFNTVAKEARHKANYLRLMPADCDKRNYEQQQSASDALEGIAKKIESLLAKYSLCYELFNQNTLRFDDARLQETVSRQVCTAIRNEIRRGNAIL